MIYILCSLSLSAVVSHAHSPKSPPSPSVRETGGVSSNVMFFDQREY